MRYYDTRKNRLVYLSGKASPDDWDERWSQAQFSRLFVSGRNAWLVAETQRYLPAGALILEGGCGCADKVHALAKSGYRAVGFDTAARTLSMAKRQCPLLELAVGDIRRLPLADGAADGYWSLGVFEHFPEGMAAQWNEAARVLRDGGFLFLTMPILSPLRRLKARWGAYPLLRDFTVDEFYQYAYSPEEVIRTGSEYGFVCIHMTLMDGVKGVKDEVALLRATMQFIYASHSLFAKLIRGVFDRVFRGFSGHVGYFIFQRVESQRTVNDPSCPLTSLT